MPDAPVLTEEDGGVLTITLNRPEARNAVDQALADGVAEALERDAHTIGEWLARFRTGGPDGLLFEQSGGSPPPSTRSSRPK